MKFQDLVFLERGFEGVIFSEKDHSYKINGEDAKTSVTQLIKKYETPFDGKKMAKIVAAKQGVLESDILHLWDFKRDYACLKGTLFHDMLKIFYKKREHHLIK
jgi:hypothetical protein